MVRFDYCGECKECYDTSEFTKCWSDKCFVNEDMIHPSGHGRYCKHCALAKGLFTIQRGYKYFCNRKCYDAYKKCVK